MSKKKVYEILIKIFKDKKNIYFKKKLMKKLSKNINWITQNKILMKELNET